MAASVGDGAWAAPEELRGGFERFFRAQYPVLVRIANGVVRDAHLAEDVAQEVLIAAERRFPDPDRSDQAVGWVRIAAVHLGLNEARGQRRRAHRHRSARPDSAPPGPEEVLVDRETESEVRQALAHLPVHSAAVLLLRHSGLSYTEVAEAMGVKTSNVGTMLRRAEAALRKEVERASRS